MTRGAAHETHGKPAQEFEAAAERVHLATALGAAACGLGKRVRFSQVTELIT